MGTTASPYDRGRQMVAGGVGAVTAKTVVAPLDRIKILLQTGATEDGLIATTRKVMMHDGVAGLWIGNAVNCVRVFPQKGVLYMSTDLYKDVFRMCFPAQTQAAFPAYMSFMVGSMAGVTASVTTYPLDLVRARMAGLLKQESRGVWATMSHVVKHEGYKGLFRGLTPTMIGAIPYEGVKFGVYDVLKTLTADSSWAQDGNAGRAYHSLVCGASAGAVASIVMFPNDTVRRIMQVQGVLMESGQTKRLHTDSSMWECYKGTYRQGIARFYRGLGANLIRVAPNTAIQFGIYEYGKYLIARSNATEDARVGAAE